MARNLIFVLPVLCVRETKKKKNELSKLPINTISGATFW